MNEKKLLGKGKEFFKKLKEYFFPGSKHEIISKSQELNNAEKLMNEGKYDEVLSILNNLEEVALTPSDQLTFHLVKSSILNKLGNYAECYKFAEQAYQESQSLKDSLLSIDALNLMAWALVWRGDLDKAQGFLTQSEDLLKSLTKESPIELEQREAAIAFNKGGISWFKGDMNQAIEYCKYSLNIREKLGIKHEIVESLYLIGQSNSFLKSDLDKALEYAERCQVLAEEINHQQMISFNLLNLGLIYNLKGEFEKALIYYETCLPIFEKNNNIQWISATLTNISVVYFHQGKFDLAFKYFEKSLNISRETGNNWFIAIGLCNIIEVLRLKGDIDQAQKYFEELKQLNDQEDNKWIETMYLITKAQILKESPRIHDRAKAEEILKQVIQREIIPNLDLNMGAMINLCELLLDELRITNDIGVLDDLKPYIKQLLDIAEKTNSFWVIAETYLLQAKLALLTSDLKGARKLLTQAQQIAEKQGMHRLAMKISIEHDNLLKELSKWENLKEQEMTLSERMELAQIDDQMKSLLWDRDLSSLEHSDEDPVLILILAEGGVTIFSHIFSKDWSYEDDLVGGFLSALNSFSSELFSEGLDRAKFGQHTVLMKPFESFSMCYVFKGQSYFAQKKINRFIESILTTEKFKDLFNSFYKTHQTIELKENPPLKLLFTDIFIHKNL
ncbi:MAG: tetratricopeptide repeat protein [Promethearchaeota archaeon]|nr:MAG: tetratricopeptide repeat protein [Candidatus Lokiarchaeota archaeon]